MWFKKGQEVADLLSIELNPQIGIEEREEYVQVKGVLELFGEYNKKESEETFSLRDFSQATTVKEVIEREDGVHEFTHYFPVDITIPKKRVRAIDDINILVDSFDYEFPESNALNIVADLSITGLYEDGQRDEEEFFEGVEDAGDVEEAEDAESEESQGKEEGGAPNSYYQSMINNVFQEFSFEARKAPVEEEVEEQEEEQFQEEYEGEVAEEQELQNQSDLEGAEQEEVHLQGEREAEEQEQFEVHHQQEVEEPELTNQRESEEQAVFEQQEQEVFEQQDREELEEQEQDEIVFPARQEIKLHFQNETKQQEQESHPQFEFLMRQVKEVHEVEATEELVEEVEEEVNVEAVVPRSENELYLTKLFGNKEENFKKVRMYIVQSGDSLESIAEKYDLQVQQITKRNQLDEFYVTEGQILYLPVKKSK